MRRMNWRMACASGRNDERQHSLIKPRRSDSLVPPFLPKNSRFLYAFESEGRQAPERSWLGRVVQSSHASVIEVIAECRPDEVGCLRKKGVINETLDLVLGGTRTHGTTARTHQQRAIDRSECSRNIPPTTRSRCRIRLFSWDDEGSGHRFSWPEVSDQGPRGLDVVILRSHLRWRF